jgi:UDP-glucose 4-epimerase
MRKILITGATGLIGSHLKTQLKGKAELYLLVRQPGEEEEGVHFIPFDMSKGSELPPLPEKIDAVIHLAQSEHFREFPEQVLDVFQVNTVTTLRLLDYARRACAKSFVLASSGVVYGGQGSFSEDEEILLRNKQLGFYHTSKLCAEAVAENYATILDVQILRFFFVYGPGQNGTMLVPRLIESVQNGTSITLDGKDGIQINPVFVGDAVDAVIESLALTGSHKINVAGPQVLSLREIGEHIGEVLGRRPVFQVKPSEGQKKMVGAINRMSDLLGEPETSFEEGLVSCLECVSN